MFDDSRPKSKTAEFPRNLEMLSIEELNNYIIDLKGEIDRVNADITKKKASIAAAASIFKN